MKKETIIIKKRRKAGGRKKGSTRGLTHRHRAFVAAYLTNGFNATQAAISAGFKCTTMASFSWCGYDALKKPAVQELLNAHWKAAKLDIDEIAGRLSEQATANPGIFFDERWNLKRPMIKQKGHLIRKLKAPGKGKPAEIELHDSQAALVKLGTHLGMFNEKVQHVGDAGGPIRHEFTVNVSASEVGATGPKQIENGDFIE